MRRWIAALLGAWMLMVTPLTAWADQGVVETAATGSLTIQGESGILYEPETGTVLWEQNAQEELAPASVTKIMTMLLTLETIGRGELSPDTVVTASQNAKEMGGSQINLDTGEQMTVHDLLMSVAVASANDAALALAEEIGGSESGFVTMMNRRAEELGMTHTQFQNPHGLPEEGHYTCAEDIALMTAALIENSLAAEYIGCETYTIRSDTNPYQMRTTNKMLSSYDGCLGGKTGYTEEAGYCMSVAAERDGMTLIAVTMQEETSEQRQEDLKQMLDFGFGHYTLQPFEDVSVEAAPIAVEGGMANEVSVVIPSFEAPSYLAEKGTTPSLQKMVTVEPSLQAPISKGQTVGNVSFTVDGETVASYDLTAGEAVDARTLFPVFAKIWHTLISL